MASMHDNGRGVELLSLDEQIERARGLVELVDLLRADAETAAAELDGIDHNASVTLARVTGDLRDARFYLSRALYDFRSLL